MRHGLLTMTTLLLLIGDLRADDWQPKQAPLMTRWAAEVDPKNTLPEYPRPHMVREKWQNLNGLWDYAIAPKTENEIFSWDGKILVPFCAESALSGVMKNVGEENQLWYRRTFTVPKDWTGDTLLHFGAVDWRTTVWVNGKEVGSHEGGYDPFSFNITETLKKDGEQQLTVAVWDPTEKGPQPRGKQLSNPHGIWYTPVTGIWQTVWIEPVAKAHIRNLTIVPGDDLKSFTVTADCEGKTDGQRVQVEIEELDMQAGVKAGEPLKISVGDNAKLWTPESPNLYEMTVTLTDGDKTVDTVETYTALRSIKVAKDDQGVNRMMLNGEPVFQYGPLDQGWWPDGLYTAPTDEALKYDIEVTKQLGFNMARKHVKTEPARWYWHCDKMGLLVWQDMPSGDKYIRADQQDSQRTAESEAIYRKEWKAIIEALKPFPSIVVWVPFNEGWGQFKTNEILAYTKQLDSTRLVDGPSGWTDRGAGDMHDMHRYPGPGMFPVESNRASVLGEFGGLGWPVEGHLWKKQNNWGYRTYQTQPQLIDSYQNLVRQLPPLVNRGLAAAVYTQTTDVEVEVNGLMTYDREIIKLPADAILKVNQRVYEPSGNEVVVLPTSQQEPQTWSFTTAEPQAGWQTAPLEDHWTTGPGGFGTAGTPGTSIGTNWNTADIWLRKTVTLPAGLKEPALRIHHDEDATVWINGRKVAELEGYVTDYVLVPLTEGAMPAGEVTIAVHCRQTGGGQYIDLGIVAIEPAQKK